MIFTQFDTGDIVSGRIQPVSTGLWSGGTSSWNSFYTSSAQTQLSSSAYEPLNGLYYTNVYDNPTGSINSDIYFSVGYGNRLGNGSSNFDISSSLLFPTLAIYNQYRNLLLIPGDSQFMFATSSNNGVASIGSDEIYVIGFTNSKYKDQLDAGQLEFTLYGSSGSITLIDDSPYNTSPLAQTGEVFNLIQGTLATGAQSSNNYQGIGLLYPALGLILLNAVALQQLVGNVTWNGRVYSLNYDSSQWNNANSFAQLQNVFFTALNNGASYTTTTGMKARVTEYVPATHYFVRVKNQEYNYSNNPTFVSGSAGQIRFSDFYTNPKVYVTSVGLYNDNNDLIAVAKLSQPLLKDFVSENLIKIKIDV